MTDIMAFRYDWNIEVLAQFHATYFYKSNTDEIHWMTEGRHYCVDFVTFNRILGFGEEHHGFSDIHDERRAEVKKIAFIYLDSRSADGKVKGLKGYCYILNYLIRHIINPKDGATSDLNGYVRNVFAKFAQGEINSMFLVSCGKKLEWQWMMQGRGCPMLLT